MTINRCKTDSLHALNAFTRHVFFFRTPAALPELQDDYAGFDVIVANILYEPLLRLAHTLAAVAVPGSKLCLTGLRSGQTEPAEQIEQSAEHIRKLSKVYEELGFQNFCSNELSAGWCLLTAEKNQAPKATLPVVSTLDWSSFEIGYCMYCIMLAGNYRM